ncbi:hypothetical protein BMG523Draft_00700 [Frankia sp. BMG5.23]|nr:hypothetical protein BMG523Draft_00700 [Frankia sp. BMG5.23]
MCLARHTRVHIEVRAGNFSFWFFLKNLLDEIVESPLDLIFYFLRPSALDSQELAQLGPEVSVEARAPDAFAFRYPLQRLADSS